MAKSTKNTLRIAMTVNTSLKPRLSSQAIGIRTSGAAKKSCQSAESRERFQSCVHLSWILFERQISAQNTYNFVSIVVVLDVEENRPPMLLARVVESVVNQRKDWPISHVFRQVHLDSFDNDSRK
ncbi:hypothetical protein HUJ05_000169 [Dendroctonus ponderosae]|nr:hypothetical protein HUJ05_000169 [Dendroctonus ponderosae]